MPKDYSFQSELLLASGVMASADIVKILTETIPNVATVERAQVADDRNGTDFWVYRPGLRPLSVDVKVRKDDPVVSFDSDDLALEIWSVEEKRTIGWSLNPAKNTDYILWLFQPTGRWALVPFPMLCRVFQQHLSEWQAQYKMARQSSDGGQWHSVCVFVPRRELWAAIYRLYGGTPPAAAS